MKNKKYPFWFYAILILIPVVFFLLLETALRIFDYGNNYSTFIELEEISRGQYFLNPDLPKKFFSGTQSVPSVIPDPFDIEKQQDAIRIFIFGGSTTAGYPYSANASFPRQIQRKLELMYPENKVEVVNLGVSAVNTYFIINILDDVISQKPDLLVFYTGHNEYYGALGPASSEFVSTTPGLVNLVLSLRETKIYQLLTNITQSLFSVFESEQSQKRSTLMEEMIEEQAIPLGSELYNDGIEQYKVNMRYILETCSNNAVPFVVCNLVSNLKQPPLGKENVDAEELFEEAERLLKNGENIKAKAKFIEAKDHDHLRFRAPSDFNEFLSELVPQAQSANLYKYFSEYSEEGITGYNLMIDHLHPNLEGYRLMAKSIYDEVNKTISKKFMQTNAVAEESVDQYLTDNFPFTRYDSTLADIKIQVLLNGFPFKSNSSFSLHECELQNYSDTLAMKSVTEGLGWAAAHRELFEHFLLQKETGKAVNELFTLMEARPFYKSALYDGITKLIGAGKIREAKHILVRNHRRYPDGYTSKQLGKINLDEGNLKLAENLLSEALKFSPNDPDILFHLSKAHFGMDNLSIAIDFMQRCLSISPDYPDAEKIYKKLILLAESE